jgi:hypothetical protein
MDNYYLNNAVYLVEEFLKGTTNRSMRVRSHTEIERNTAGTVIRRCRTGSHGCDIIRCTYRRSSSESRRRHPQGADVTSWRY